MEFLFYFIPKGFLHCQFSIVNCQLINPFIKDIPSEREGIDRQKFSNQVIITWHFPDCKAEFLQKKEPLLRLLWFYPWKSPVMALTVT